MASISLITKGIVGTSSIVAPVSLGVIYRDNIKELIYKQSEPVSQATQGNTNSQKIQELGLENTDCKLSNNECTLSIDAIKKLTFFDGTNDLKVTNTSSTAKLKIEKVSNHTDIFGSDRVKITLKDFNSDIEAVKTDNESTKITLKQGTNPEFKINSGKLERSWTISTLSQKAGLNCSSSEAPKECSFTDNTKVNLWESDSNKLNDATIKSDNKNKKISFEEGVADYNQGFKFTPKEDIELELATTTSGENKKLSKDSNYQLLFKEEKWYFCKKQ